MAKKKSVSKPTTGRKTRTSTKAKRGELAPELQALIKRGDRAYDAFRHEEALEAYSQAISWKPSKSLPLEERFRLIRQRAETYRALGNFEQQSADVVSLERLAVRSGRVDLIAEAAFRRADLGSGVGDPQRTIRLAKKALKMARSAGDEILQAKALDALGSAYLFGRELVDQAREHLERALELFGDHSEAYLSHAHAWVVLAFLPGLEGTETSERYALKGLDLVRQAGDQRTEARVLNLLAIFANDAADKRRYAEQALALAQELDLRETTAQSFNHLSLVYLHMGLYETALDFITRGVEIARHGLGRMTVSAFLESYARVAMALDDHASAEAAFREALEIAEEGNQRSFIGYNTLGLGRLKLASGNPKAAARLVKRAADVFRELGQVSELPTSLAALAEVRLAQNKWTSALRLAIETVGTLQSVSEVNQDFPPQDVWWTYFKVLRAHPKNRKYLDTKDHSKGRLDDEAERALARAFELAKSNVAEVTDTGLKRSYWNRVEINRSILLETAKINPGDVQKMFVEEGKTVDLQEQLQRMLDIGVRMNEIRDPDDLTSFVMDQLVELSGAEDVALIFEDEGSMRTCLAQRGFASGVDPVAFARPLLDEAARVSHGVIQKGVADVNPSKKAKGLFDSLSTIAVPLQTLGGSKSYLVAANHTLFGAFSQADLTLISAFANQAAAALDNAALYSDLEHRVEERTQALEDRAAELSFINTIQRALASNLDLSKIYEIVGDQLRSIFASQAVTITSADTERGRTHFVYSYEKGQLFEPFDVPLNSFYRWLLDGDETFVRNGDAPEFASKFKDFEVPIGEMAKSMVWVPIPHRSEDRWIESITIEDIDGDRLFGDADVRLLETLAGGMAVALENARLLDETRQRNAELGVINSIQEGLASELDIQAIFDLVGDRIRDIFDAQIVGIITYDPDKDMVDFRYAIERGQRWDIPSGPPRGFSRHIINTGETLVINENMEAASKKYDAAVIAGEEIKSFVGVPLVVGGRVRGGISLQNIDHENAFSDSDVRLLTTLASSMSVALENARLFDETQVLLEQTEDRAAELTLINSIQRALAAELDMASIYETVGKQLASIFEFQVIVIYTADLDKGEMRTEYGFEKGHRIPPMAVPFNSLYDDLLADKKTFLFNGDFPEYASQFKDYKVPFGELPKSLIGVPIPRRSDPNLIDIIGLQDIDGERFFTKSDVRLLETLANSMGVALENARLMDETKRLLQETEQRAAELSIINSVQQGLASKLDMQAIYDLVGNRIRDIFDAQVVHIRTYDLDTDEMTFPFVLDRDERLDVPPIKVEGIGISGEIIRTRQPLFINRDYRAHAEALGSYLLEGQKEWPKSAVGCPIMAGDKVTGIVLVQNFDREDVFTDNDLDLLTTLASSMSVALENARLFDETNRLLEETRQRAAELAIINNVGQALVKKLEFDAILEMVGQRVRELFKSDTMYIMLYDAKSNIGQMAYYVDRDERIEVEGGILDTGLGKIIVDSKEPLLLATAEESGRLGALRVTGEANEDLNESFIGVPFFNGDEVSGVISVQSYERYAYDEADVALLSTLASSMSVALENARLFEETHRLLEETRQRNAELAVINKVQEGLASKLDLSGIVEVVGDEIAHILHSENVSIGLMVDDGQTIITPYFLEDGKRWPVDPIPFEQTTYWREAIETRKPLLPDYESAKKTVLESGGGVGDPDAPFPKSNLFVPILAGKRGVGVIMVADKERENAYTESDVSLVVTLANSMSVALENARLFEETNRLLEETSQRNAELAVINSIQDGLASQLDIQGIFDLVGDKIRDIFDAQGVSISTYDKATGIESVPYIIERGQRLHVDPEPTWGLAAHIYETLEPLMINENLEEVGKKYGAGVNVGEPTKSYLGVPLVVGGEPKGHITLQNIDREHAFSESDLRLLTTIASSMSVALENARLFEETTRLLEETRQRAEELSLINDIGTALSKKLEFEAILELVGERVRQIFNADTMFILLYDPASELAHMVYYVDRGERHDLGAAGPAVGLTKVIIDAAEPLLLGTREAADELGSLRIAKPGEEDLNQSFLGVPFFRGDGVAGVISVQSYQTNRYDKSDIRLLTTLATSMSVALENAQLFEETTRLLEEARQHNTELAAVNTVGQALVAETEIDNLIQLIGDQVRTTFRADIAYVALFDPATDMVNFPYLFGEDLSPQRPDEGLTGQILKSGKPLLLNRDIEEAMAEMHAERVGVASASYLGVPIVVGRKPIGVISVQSTLEEGRFGESDVDLLTTIAANAGAAIRNAQLLAETERRASEMASMNEIGREASASLDLYTILDRITNSARTMLGAQSSAVILLEEDGQTLRPIAAAGDIADELMSITFEIGEGIIGDVVKKGRAERISDALADPRAVQIEGTEPTRSGDKLMVAPLFARETVIGAMAVWRGPADDMFDENSLSLLTGLSQQAGASIQNARLFAEVERQKQYMEAVVENSPVAIVTVDGDFRVVSWNPAAEKLFGYSESEAIGQDAHVLHSKDEAILEESHQYSEQIAAGERVQAITQRTRKDGSFVDVEVMGVPVVVEGEQVGNIIIYHDISELKKTEAALMQQKEYLAAVVSNSPVAIVTADQDARVVSWNPAAETLFGYTFEEAIGEDIDRLIALRDSDMRDEAKEYSQRAREGRLHENTQRTRKDGSLVDVELLGVPVTVDGEQAGIIAIYHDITELKRATEEAQAANEAKSAFLATMSHEIRTPMNAVIGMSGLLLDTELSDEQHEFAEIIRNSSDSLLAIINDILDFSKIEAGKMELEDQPFDVRECVEGTLDLVAGRAFEKDLDLAYFIEDGTPTRIIGDVTRFRQILLNLLTNAVKFTDQGEVVVTAGTDEPSSGSTNGGGEREGEHQLHIRVRDTGIGIPPDRMDRLFQSFSQVDASTARRYGGTGLGLAISKRLTEMMGGSMWAESKPGEGTTFHFTVRAKEAEGAEETTLQSSEPQLYGQRVLVVDDNDTNRRILGLQVKGWGMRPRDTHSPRQALEWIKEGEAFDVAVLDMHMPELDGLSLAREIRAYRDADALPLILFTSLGRREVDVDDIEFAAFLTKPIKPSQLLDALTSIFAGQPAKASRVGVEPPRIDPELGGKHPLRILLAEDNAVNQKLAIRLLQQMGYRADVAANGLEVLDSLGRQTYDVVLMDVQMPEMDGLEASREINRRWSQSERPRIVAMTANAMQGDRERCIEAGMDDYISKPVRVNELMDALVRVSARPGEDA